MNSYHRIVSQTSRQSGYSLFEVMIAVVVTTLGLLGLAGVQATGLRNNLSAYQRSQATVLAYDISDRMRANTTAIENYLSSYMTLDAAVIAGAVAGCKTTDGCTSAEMAQTDLVDWHTALTTAMPDEITTTGTITVDDRGTGVTDDDIYVINISWDDNRDGVINTDPDDDIEDDPNFQMSFQPLNSQPVSF